MIDRGGRLEPIPQSDPVEPALGLPVERAGAILPADLLQGGEVIILLLKPSLLYIVLGCLGTLALIAGTAALLIGLRQVGAGTFSTSEVFAGALLLITIRIVWQTLEWFSRTYVLTNRRIIRIRGVIRVQIFEASLPQLQHTELVFSLRERLFRLGTIAFATAGSAFPEAYWLMISRPLAIHRRIVQEIHRTEGDPSNG